MKTNKTGYITVENRRNNQRTSTWKASKPLSLQTRETGQRKLTCKCAAPWMKPWQQGHVQDGCLPFYSSEAYTLKSPREGPPLLPASPKSTGNPGVALTKISSSPLAIQHYLPAPDTTITKNIPNWSAVESSTKPRTGPANLQKLAMLRDLSRRTQIWPASKKKSKGTPKDAQKDIQHRPYGTQTRKPASPRGAWEFKVARSTCRGTRRFNQFKSAHIWAIFFSFGSFKGPKTTNQKSPRFLACMSLTCYTAAVISQTSIEWFLDIGEIYLLIILDHFQDIFCIIASTCTCAGGPPAHPQSFCNYEGRW